MADQQWEEESTCSQVILHAVDERITAGHPVPAVWLTAPKGLVQEPVAFYSFGILSESIGRRLLHMHKIQQAANPCHCLPVT